jgi:hypothetical protein
MSHAENQPTDVQGGTMGAMTGYAQPLRAIGQALEILKIQQFEMEPAGDNYLVRGSIRCTGDDLSNSQRSADELQSIWGDLSHVGYEGRSKYESDERGVLSPIELHYTAQDIERLDEAGRARRGKSEKAADASSLSQVLRCIGGYLTQKRARLLKVARDSDFVAVDYETSMGSQIRETLAVKDLYDLWVRMYLQRAGRTTH